MNPSTLYDTLGVARSASHEELKAAYRRLAATLHPDRDGGDPERMSALNAAYGVLSDPVKRKHYDETGFAKGPSMTLEQKANAVMMQMFAGIMGQVPDAALPYTDLFGKLREALDEKLRQNYAQRGKLEASIARVKKLRARVKGGELFEQVFESNERGARNGIADLDEQDQVIGLIHRHLDGYSMECEEAPGAMAKRSGESAPAPGIPRDGPPGEWVSMMELLKNNKLWDEINRNKGEWEHNMQRDAYRRKKPGPEKPYFREDERW